MDYQGSIEQQVAAVAKTVGEGLAIHALSSGVARAVVTVLGPRLLGARLPTVFITNLDLETRE